MLSFMREQGSGNGAEPVSADTGPQGVESPGDTGPQEFLTVATTRKTLRRSTIVVVVLLVVGLACLYMMIRRIQPQAAAAQASQAEQAKIEQAIGRLTGASTEMVGRMDAIVKKFYEFSDVFQVKVSELTKNPFEVEGGVKTEKPNPVVAEDPLLRAQMQRNQRLQQQVSTLKLLCITQPGQNGSRDFYCVINDQQLRQGDKVEDFTVRRIGSNSVDLVWSNPGGAGSGSETEDVKITLKLSQ
jgi:preprotein translocase subunit SecG